MEVEEVGKKKEKKRVGREKSKEVIGVNKFFGWVGEGD